MSSQSGWSTSSLLSEPLNEETDDFILADNERLKERVDELEKVVSLQRNEIMLLQASTADVLRRLQTLENGPPTTSTLPRSNGRMSSSRSTYAIPAGPLRPPTSPMSRSLYSSSNGGDAQELTPRRSSTSQRGQDFVNVSIGRSARGSPLRKWVSNHNVKENGSPIVSPSVASTPAVTTLNRIISRTSSTLSLQSVSSTHNRTTSFRKNSRPPIFLASSHTLQLTLANRSLSIPVPTDRETIDLTAEQEPPDIKASLKRVYSYRGKDVRANVKYLPTGEVVFFTGNIIVLHNLEENTQRFYHEHTCDVKCIAVHPNRVLMASGQASCHSNEKVLKTEHVRPVDSPDELVKQLENEHTEAHVRIWDSIKLQTVIIIGGFETGFEKGICQLSFSTTDVGAILACVDESTKHILSLWNWDKKKKLAETKAANDLVFECHWHPNYKNQLVVYGRGHLSFFHYDPTNGILVKSAAIFEGRDKPKTVLSMCFTSTGHVATGDSNGTISLWDPKSCRTIKQAHGVHPGGVYALMMATKIDRLLSGGKDKVLSEWQPQDLVRTRRFELAEERGTPRIIIADAPKLLIGTSTNTLLIGTLEQGFTSIIEGDAGDVTSLCTTSDCLITASSDGNVRSWDTSKGTVNWSRNFLEGVECMDVDSNNINLLMGCNGGSWQIVKVSTQEVVEEHRDSTQPVTCVRFSPNGNLFFVATKQLCGLIYHLHPASCQQLSRITNFSSPIISADWDSDSQFIRANSSANHLYLWNKKGEVVEPKDVQDINWETCSCRISFEAAMVAHSSNGGLTCVTKSSDGKLLAAGIDNGTVRVYTCPVLSQTAGCVELSGHSNGVNNVASAPTLFSNTLFSSGSIENSILQWNIE
ncbi:unnamed protein product [Caenorhabditis auriculariae]|uniref:HELP domain-containing protein n=1 Tax=Caenorhabditis auriculariae TaxID=2777116 RepID=A0A8S1HAG5_9PELO|nr:unnamed protein product [Caenorhabditis auriculariae]